MCTVTYVPDFDNGKRFVLTDNRDEAVNRPAVPPKIYREHDAHLYYPKDKKAGGTWFGVSDNHHVLTLMNGAFKRHKRQKSYKESRGVVVKKLIATQDIKTAFERYDLEGIEAFFAVVVSWGSQLEICELIWDGKERYINQRNADKPIIWSSAMLYDNSERHHKEKRFEDFLKLNNKKSLAASIWDFHHSKSSNDDLGLIIDRGILKTTSVSQLSLNTQDELTFRYQDLISGFTQKEKIEW